MTARTRRGLFSALAIIVALAWVFPVYWMVNSAFLPNIILQSFIPTFFPVKATLSNFTGALADGTTLSVLVDQEALYSPNPRFSLLFTGP